MKYTAVEIRVSDNGVALLCMNNPEKRNALTRAMRGDLKNALGELAARPDARVVVITGHDSVFCAGLDLAELSSLSVPAQAAAFTEEIEALFNDLLFHPLPTIAAVSGPAYAGGFDLAALCDIRVASDTATFCQAELRLAVSPISSPLWMNVGLSRAKELAFTADPITAAEALRIGLVNHVFPPGKYLDGALELAGTIARHDPAVLKSVKAQINLLAALPLQQAIRLQFLAIRAGFGSEATSTAAARILENLGSKPRSGR
ncbi:MAG: enoyl-CoA hydratase/isomerase family protein [bacterium]